MSNALIRKLASFETLSEDDSAAIEALCRSPVRRKAGTHLIRDGDRPEEVFLLLEGWACRYKHTRSGDRQIVAFLLPGDLCDPHVFILAAMDHSISLVSDAEVVAIPKNAILDLTTRSPAIARGLWWSSLVDEAILREWLVNMGQREAYGRLAHLFCELWQRMYQVGLTREGEFSLPLTQEQLGDTVGLTSVHVNRTLQRMRGEGLISIGAKQLTIHDSEGMKRIADFDPNYLHLEPRPEHSSKSSSSFPFR